MAPYFDCLPQRMATFPIFYRPEVQQQLQYPMIETEIQARLQFIYELVEGPFQEQLPPEHPLRQSGAELFAWCFSIVSSRGLRLTPPYEAALIPGVDLCNHSARPNCTVEIVQDEEFNRLEKFRLRATQPIASGEELLLKYGDFSNDTLLPDYGFVLPPEVTGCETVSVGLSQQLLMSAGSPLILLQAGEVARQNKWLGSNQFLPGEMSPPRRIEDWHVQKLVDIGLLPGVLGGDDLVVELGGNQNEGIPAELLAAVRVISAIAPEDVPGSTCEEVASNPLSDKRLEAKALGMILGVVQCGLSSFPSTYEDDEQYLQPGADQIGPSMETAIRYRMYKKKSLLLVGEAICKRLVQGGLLVD
mmetsp:Transcript_12575/g.45870  ORF Transcript_12575/g.45870 Transcript_12575/m.45870 type:complete len:360 (-) Transcript_12575:1985-3064(-)